MPGYFQSLMGNIGRILSDHGIENAIKFDDLLLWFNSYKILPRKG